MQVHLNSISHTAREFFHPKPVLSKHKSILSKQMSNLIALSVDKTEADTNQIGRQGKNVLKNRPTH